MLILRTAVSHRIVDCQCPGPVLKAISQRNKIPTIYLCEKSCILIYSIVILNFCDCPACRFRPDNCRFRKYRLPTARDDQKIIVCSADFELTLSLFVLRVLADDPDAALSLNNFALLTDRFY